MNQDVLEESGFVSWWGMVFTDAVSLIKRSKFERGTVSTAMKFLYDECLNMVTIFYPK